MPTTVRKIVPIPFYELAMDILQVDESTGQKKYIFVVMDTFTKFTKAFVLKNRTAPELPEFW